MTTQQIAPPDTTSGGSVLRRALVVAVASLLLGGVTSLAQTVPPHVLAPVANSASGWAAVTALLVHATRLRPRPAAVLGAVSLVLLVLGYTLASRLRGLTYDPVLFATVGVVVGPFVGLAASWLRTTGLRAALGTAALAGVAVGEAAYGLTVVRSTTSPVYWSAVGVVGVALLVTMVTRRVDGGLPRTVAVGGAIAVAALFVPALLALGRV